jgi:hypothetical protein
MACSAYMPFLLRRTTSLSAVALAVAAPAFAHTTTAAPGSLSLPKAVTIAGLVQGWSSPDYTVSVTSLVAPSSEARAAARLRGKQVVLVLPSSAPVTDGGVKIIGEDRLSLLPSVITVKVQGTLLPRSDWFTSHSSSTPTFRVSRLTITDDGSGSTPGLPGTTRFR